MLSLLTSPWKIGTIALGILLAVSLGWGARVDSLRADHLKAYDTLHREAGVVVAAVQAATGVPGEASATWETVPARINALGASNGALKSAINDQNTAIAGMKAAADLAKLEGDKLRSEIAAAQAGRADAVAKLKEMQMTPGAKDCPTLLKQATDALDLARDAGL